MRRANLTVVTAGKLVKDAQVETAGKTTTTTATTTTTSATTAGVSKLVIAGDTSSTTINSTQTNLSIVGGRSIKTSVQGSQLIISLNEAVSFSQAVINSANTISPLIIKNSNNQVVFWINTQGVPVLEPKTTLPPVTSGMVYISGSASTPEGFYLGFPVDTPANNERTDVTNL